MFICPWILTLFDSTLLFLCYRQFKEVSKNNHTPKDNYFDKDMKNSFNSKDFRDIKNYKVPPDKDIRDYRLRDYRDRNDRDRSERDRNDRDIKDYYELSRTNSDSSNNRDRDKDSRDRNRDHRDRDRDRSYRDSRSYSDGKYRTSSSSELL